MTLKPSKDLAHQVAEDLSLANAVETQPQKAYFNYGGQGPLAEGAIEAMTQAWQESQALGPFSLAVGRWVVAQTEATRQAIANELGTTSGAIALTEDTTVGCNIVLWGIEWQPGDRILMSDCEHPGIVAAVLELQRRFGVAIDVLPWRDQARHFRSDADWLATLQVALRPETRLLVLSHIHWNTGDLVPLAAIGTLCQEINRDRLSLSSREPTDVGPARPLQILVDAAQSVGVLPLNLSELPIDFYAFTGHKWLCGPEGLGGLYVRPGASLNPAFIGWRGITTDRTGNPTGFKPDARRYEIATSAYPLQAGLRVAIASHDVAGSAETRYRAIVQKAGQVWERLQTIPGLTCWRSTPPETGLVSFQVQRPPSQDLGSNHHAKLVDVLENQGIFLRTIADPDCIRACLHYTSSQAEIDRLITTLQTILT